MPLFLYFSFVPCPLKGFNQFSLRRIFYLVNFIGYLFLIQIFFNSLDIFIWKCKEQFFSPCTDFKRERKIVFGYHSRSNIYKLHIFILYQIPWYICNGYPICHILTSAISIPYKFFLNCIPQLILNFNRSFNYFKYLSISFYRCLIGFKSRNCTEQFSTLHYCHQTTVLWDKQYI